MVFYGSEESEEIFFELEADEFFGAHVGERGGTRRVTRVPGGGDCLRQEVNPPAIGRRERKGRSKGGRCNGDGAFVNVDEDIAVAVLLLEEERIG